MTAEVASAHQQTYKDYVRLQSRLNPCLSDLVRYLDREHQQPSTVVCLDFDPRPSEPRIVTDAELIQLLNDNDIPAPHCGRVFFVQDIQPRLVRLLGEVLDIDPLFFAGHITTNFGDLEHGPPPPSQALLPSQLVVRDHFHIHYQQVLDLGHADAFAQTASYGLLVTGTNVPRNVRRLPPLSGQRQLGLRRACCSVLSKRVGQGWIGLVLVDPPAAAVTDLPGKGGGVYPSMPVHGGIEDVVPPESFSAFRAAATASATATAAKSSARGSMLTNLVHYFRSQSPPGLDADHTRLAGLCYYPIRVSLAEWNTYGVLTTRYFKHYEYASSSASPSGALSQLDRDHDRDLVDLQRWRRRSKQSQHKLALVAAFLGEQKKRQQQQQQHNKGLQSTTTKAMCAWEDLALCDIDGLRTQLAQFNESLEPVVVLALSMVQLNEARRSSKDAANVKRLTLIALVFVPLSYVASLFSMSDEYAPGRARFWVYIASALSVLVVVVVLSVLTALNPTRLAAWVQRQRQRKLRRGRMKNEGGGKEDAER